MVFWANTQRQLSLRRVRLRVLAATASQAPLARLERTLEKTLARVA